MAFFTHIKLNVPPVPTEPDDDPNSTLKPAPERSPQKESRFSSSSDNAPTTLNSEQTVVNEVDNTVISGGQVLGVTQNSTIQKRFDYVVDRDMGVEV